MSNSLVAALSLGLTCRNLVCSSPSFLLWCLLHFTHTEGAGASLRKDGFSARLVTNALLLICLASKHGRWNCYPAPARAEAPPLNLLTDVQVQSCYLTCQAAGMSFALFNFSFLRAVCRIFPILGFVLTGGGWLGREPLRGYPQSLLPAYPLKNVQPPLCSLDNITAVE